MIEVHPGSCRQCAEEYVRGIYALYAYRLLAMSRAFGEPERVVSSIAGLRGSLS